MTNKFVGYITITVADNIKTDAQVANRQLHQGIKIKTTMLSGDKTR